MLAAVEELMREQGLARITTRAIARKAGLTEGTLYNHFREKDEIFIAASLVDQRLEARFFAQRVPAGSSLSIGIARPFGVPASPG